MSKPADDLQAAVAELVAETPPEPASHLTADELIAYHTGKLSPAEQARMEDHLVLVPEDASLLLDLAELTAGELGHERPVSEFEQAAAWRDLRSRVAPRDDAPPRPGPVIAFPRKRAGIRAAPSLSWLHAVAASLLLCVLGLSGWVFTLRQTVTDISRPQLNAPVENLYASASRGEDDVTVMTLGPDDRLFTLVLNPAWRDLTAEPDEYQAEIVRSDGEPVWSGRGLRPNVYGSLSLILSRRLVADGDYRIRLYGAGEPRGEPVAEFALRIEQVPEAR